MFEAEGPNQQKAIHGHPSIPKPPGGKEICISGPKSHNPERLAVFAEISTKPAND